MKFINNKQAGDTLIEVLFAFVILSSVIGVAFGGAMASYRSALTAQNRTQALFLAQYQADALKTYRDSLDWDSSGGLPSFLNGKIASPPLGDDNLTPVSTGAGSLLQNFCMTTFQAGPSQPIYWKLEKIPSGGVNNCKLLAKTLAPNLQDPEMEIDLKYPPSNTDRIEAIVTVSYKPASGADPNYREKVTNSILLIK